MVHSISGLTNAAINEFAAVKDMKAVLYKASEEFDAASLILTITAVCFAALGLIMIASAACLIPLGIAGFSAYCAYNLAQMKTNIDAIIENPKDFVKLDGSSSLIKADLDAIKAELKKNTVYFDLAIDELMQSTLEHSPAPSA